MLFSTFGTIPMRLLSKTQRTLPEAHFQTFLASDISAFIKKNAWFPQICRHTEKHTDIQKTDGLDSQTDTINLTEVAVQYGQKNHI